MARVDDEWLEARLTKTETLIVAYEDAILALSSGAQTYSLDTGQTRQSVTKANLSEMRNALDMLERRREAIKARLDGHSTRVIPGW